MNRKAHICRRMAGSVKIRRRRRTRYSGSQEKISIYTLTHLDFFFFPSFLLRPSLLSFGHDRETAGTRLKSGPPPLLVRRRADQGGERPPHPLSLHGTNPDERIRHRRPPGVKPVRRRTSVLVEAAPEGSGVISRRAHTRLPRRRRRKTILLLDDSVPRRRHGQP